MRIWAAGTGITDNAGNPGAGGFTKTGGGALVLNGANTYTGTTTVNAGTLAVNGSIASSTAAFNVNNGGTLSGAGAVNRTVTLNTGGTVAPEGSSAVDTLSAASLNWNGGGKLAFDLDSASDRLALSGALTRSGAGAYEFVFTPGDGMTAGKSYTLVTFGSTNFTAEDFSYTGLPEELKGKFTLNAGSLQFTVLDAIRPTLNLPADITPEATSPAGAVATYTATADDNLEGSLAVSFSIPSGSTFPLGTTEVTATAADSAGNTASGTFKVTVRDTTAPSVNYPPDIVTAAAPGAPTAAVTFNVTGSDTASDVTVTTSHASGSAFPVGTTAVNATATDASANRSACTFTVTVRSSTPTTVAPAAAQYSDSVTLQAAVAAAPVPGQPLAGGVQFFVNGQPVGSAPLTNGVAALPYTVNSPAGTYSVTAQFTGTGPAYVDSASARVSRLRGSTFRPPGATIPARFRHKPGRPPSSRRVTRSWHSPANRHPNTSV